MHKMAPTPSKRAVKKPNSGAQLSDDKPLFGGYMSNHIKTLKQTLHEQKRRPLAAFFTCSVIGIAIALPTLLALLLINIYQADLEWDGSSQITLFLTEKTATLEAAELANALQERGSISATKFIDKDKALAEFSALFELGDTLKHLEENPLPHSIIVTPAPQLDQLEKINRLKDSLVGLEQVENAQLDVVWVERLHSISTFLERSTWVLGIMLSFAVLLILGNTIRLAIENRKDEIVVLKLVGGTNAFVCRPFIYMGIFFGFGGALFALVLCTLVIAMLEAPLLDLAQSYQSQFNLMGLSVESSLLILTLGSLLGWLGAWFAVRRHIDEIEPR
jgi:cell division transport system permease protein